MPRTGSAPFLTVAALLGALLAPAPFTHAQGSKPASGGSKDSTPADPAAENEALKQKIKELEEQLEQAQKRIKDLNTDTDSLRKEIKRLQKEGGGGATPTPSPGQPVKPSAPSVPNSKPGGPSTPETGQVSGDPLSSPAALMQTLQRDYEKKFGSAPKGTPAEVAKLKRAVEQWVSQQPRQFKGQTDWTIRVLEAETNPNKLRPLRVKYEVLQTGTDKVIGEPCQSMFEGRFAKMMSDSPNQKKWKLTATIVAKPVFDPERDAGDKKTNTSDRPLIGPYAVFDFEVTVVNLNPTM